MKVTNSVTTYGLDIGSSSHNIPYTSARLVDRRNDLSKRWYIEFYTLNGETGQLVRKQVIVPARYKTVKERKTWASEEIKKINQLLAAGYHYNPQKGAKPVLDPEPEKLYTYIEAINLAIDKKIAQGRKRTQQTYSSFKNVFLSYAEVNAGDLNITEVTKRHVIQFMDYLQEVRQIKNTTYNNYLEYFRALFNELVKREIISKNPSNGIDFLPEETGRNIAFTPTEQSKIEHYLLENDLHLYYFTRFIYYGFVRPNELVQLQIKNIDLKHKRLTIPAHIGKNKEQRTIIIVKPLADIISKMQLHQFPENYLLFAQNLKPGKKAIAPTRASERHKKVLEELKLYNGLVTLYSWKHTDVVNAFRAGLDIKKLQSQLRHYSLEETDKYLKSLGLVEDKELEEKVW